MSEFDKILEQNEQILWEGKPMFWPFFLTSFAASLFGLIFLVVGGMFVLQGIREGNYFMVLIPHFWIGVLFTFGAPIYSLMVYKHVNYALTNKRALFQTGVIGRDFKMVDFDKITNSDVTVGLTDILFGKKSGSIKISTAGTLYATSKGGVRNRPFTFANIPNPYEVFKYFKEISHAVKTDIEYPNAYRPQVNPGYNSEYKNEQQ